MAKYQPLRISCLIADGNIVSDDGIFPLDAILAAAWTRKHYPIEYYNDGAKKKDNGIEIKLPLAEIEMQGQKFWSASIAQYKKYGEYIYYWHKRFRSYLAEKYLDKPKRVNTSSAQYKNYRMPVNVCITGPLTWFCVGDIDEIRDLLANIKSIGKKRAYGFGQIALDNAGRPAWIVKPWHEDWSIRDSSGRLMRHIPFSGEFKPEMMVRHWGVRPPCWLPENQIVCEIPEVGDWDGGY